MDRPAQGSESRNRQVIADLVAAGDPERWLAATYARRQARPGLAALFALDISLGRLVASTNEPMIGAIRIAWWREALEKLHQPPLPGEPVLQALAHEVTRSEEHTSELQSLMRISYAVFCLKKQKEQNQ